MYIAMGLSLGVAFGVIFSNITWGLIIGLAAGTVMEGLCNSSKRKKGKKDGAQKNK